MNDLMWFRLQRRFEMYGHMSIYYLNKVRLTEIQILTIPQFIESFTNLALVLQSLALKALSLTG